MNNIEARVAVPRVAPFPINVAQLSSALGWRAVEDFQEIEYVVYSKRAASQRAAQEAADVFCQSLRSIGVQVVVSRMYLVRATEAAKGRASPAEKNDLIVTLVRELTGNPHLTCADVTIRNGKVRMIETN